MTGSYWIETWGCQMNEHDSEKMSGTLEGLGYEAADRPEHADVVLLNTCAIREKAEEKIYQYLHRLRPAKKARPDMIIGVAGCVGQMSGEGIRERVPFVDLVIGPRGSNRLPDYLARLKSERGIVDTTLYQDNLFASQTPARRLARGTKAYVTVVEGCNKTCTYCIVPTTRGREVSRPLEDLLSESRALVDDGFQEIEFLGQNVNAWRDPTTKAKFENLLRAAARIEGLKRIRFTTSHPLHFTTEIMRAMAELPEVCDYLHLPAQSGSSRVLKLMRRGYDREGYLSKIDELRALVPDIVLSTDMIVGFPGETEQDFRESLSLVREVGYDSMFSFVYSARPGTVSAMMVDDVAHERKAERLAELQSLQREIQHERKRGRVGRTERVIIESASRRDPGEWAGRTVGNEVVNFSAPWASIGDEVEVRIVSAGPNSYRGASEPPEKWDGAGASAPLSA